MPRKDTPRVQRFPPGTRVTERKFKPGGAVSTFTCELIACSRDFALVFFRVERPSAFNTPVPIPAGTRSYGFFWHNRPYNAYRFIGADGRLIAHRFDAVTAVRITSHEIAYRDLALDWWVLEDGVLLEEDREEFEALIASGAFSSQDAEAATRATQTVYSRYRHIIDELADLQHRLVIAPR